MSKRNFTLLIIFIVIALSIGFGFLYFYKSNTSTTTTGVQDTNFVSKFFPFLKSASQTTTTTPITPVDISGYENSTVTETAKLKLTKISTMPVAGYGVFLKERFKEVPIVTTSTPVVSASETPVTLPATKKGKVATVKPTPPATEFVPALRYVEKTTGNIYQTLVEKIEERKFTTTIIPAVHDAYFGNKGESVILRYLKTDDKTIETFAGILPKEILGGDTTVNTEIKGSFLPENLPDLSISSDALSMFYLFNIGDGTVGITSGLMGEKKAQIFNSPFTDWLSQYPNSKMVTLTTKPSSSVPGYMYAIDPAKKDFNKVLGNINGLTTLTSPNGKIVLYSNDTLTLNLLDLSTGGSTLLGLKTLPEKCVWGKNSDAVYCSVPKYVDQLGYPDVWYQGEVSFADQIWKIDATTGIATIIADPVSLQGGEDVDGTKLSLDDGENYLFFVNKKDSYLWKLDLK